MTAFPCPFCGNAKMADRIAALEQALRPFAAAAAEVDRTRADHERLGMGRLSDNASPGLGIKFGDLLRAREVIANAGAE